MKIKDIEMRNFRCFEELKVNLDDDYTVFIGINGSGKSTILDAISLAMGSYLSGFDNISPEGIHIDDAHYKVYKMGSNVESQRQFPVDIIATADINGSRVNWKRSLNGEKRKTTIADAKAIRDIGYSYQKMVREGDDSCILPLVAYYGTGRLWMQKKSKKSKSKKIDINRTVGYVDSLDVASNEKLMIKWFEKMTYIQLQTGETVPELEAVKSAMSKCYLSADDSLTSVNFIYDVNSEEIEIVMKHNDERLEKLPMKSLSDGIKGVLSMVADIAYRMAILNPQLLGDVLKTPGIVLIDEVDMHLHPEWQKKIISDLTSIFKEVQFVFTTHSPSIVANVPKENIWILDEHKLYRPSNNTYGRDVGSILAEIMASDVRPSEVKKLIENFYLAIDDSDIDKAGTILGKMRDILGDHDSDVVKAQVYLDFEGM
ncbi:MAG: AAA family ATPase [Tissierellales bacterium]|nr:AAA family ATPase [Tissierellales bacterium]